MLEVKITCTKNEDEELDRLLQLLAAECSFVEVDATNVPEFASPLGGFKRSTRVRLEVCKK
ncbi:hypothetical protein EUAN_07170 [Andreesenia angusta]|uniref:Uncharacterized protein n=1 Tax=Andreesenia angusta TaxID=39480 RepID=A0A1S1V8K2_9FIRM|nr:hypothetical protein [Andreesenia angusta]OHW62933.1 hypothetical protein EUAN_07170 [Andreesenia angusta]